MGSVKTPRLYRKSCGTYFLRVIASALVSSPDNASRQRKEVRFSLRTKDPSQARSIAAWANARLELARDMSDRNNILNSLGIRKMLTIGPNGITVENDQDVANLLRIQQANPNLLEAFAVRRNPDADAIRQMMEEAISRRSAEHRVQGHAVSDGASLSSSPPNPLRMSKALEQYKAASSELSPKTLVEKDVLLKKLAAHVAASKTGGDPDPFVHDIGTHHLSTFLDALSKKTATDGTRTAEATAPRTLMKKISSLRAFFEWASEELEATRSNPVAGLGRRDKNLRKAASKTKSKDSYHPFSTGQIETIFAPKTYLAFNNRSDYFWAPLLGVHLGTRLKEIVTLELEHIGRHQETGIWFMDVTPEHAKNDNSVRRLPIPSRLIELGFIDYVERLRSLGATHLFPHRDMSLPTVELDPSGNCSDRFAKYLNTLGIRDRGLVFHSFRHTAVSALQDAGVPPSDAMQITGHQAQDHAISTGKMTVEQARSVFTTTYTHADKARLNTEYPLAKLHHWLDLAIQVPLDYPSLTKAASIVTEHLVKTKDGFHSGWFAGNRKYAEKQIKRLSKL